MQNRQTAALFTADLEASASNLLPSPSQTVAENLLPLRDWNMQEPVLQTRAAISVEVAAGQDKILFSQNQQEKLPIASLTKLMTGLIVLEHYDLDQEITINEAAMSQEGEQGNLKLGEVLTVRALLRIMLMESSNRAAYALAESRGVPEFLGLMNVKAQELGLANTFFQDVTGLGDSSYSTAHDLVRLTEYLFDNHSLFKEVISFKEYDLYLPDGTFHHTLVSTNELLGQDTIIGGKTGFTNIAKGCFIVIQKNPGNNHYIISVVLGSDDRFSQMQYLIDWVGDAYEW